MFGSIPDAYDLFEQRDREQEEWRKRLPRCMNCGEHIQQETAIFLDCVGKWVCDECADNREEVTTE